VDLEALSIARRLTVADALTDPAKRALERRRQAAYQLAWGFAMAKTPRTACSMTPVNRLLTDADPLPRSYGIAAVHQYRLTRLPPGCENCRRDDIRHDPSFKSPSPARPWRPRPG
jgi:hypothetical protein